MNKIDVKIPGKEYSVLFGSNIFGKLFHLIDEKKLSKNILFVIDSNVLALHRNKLSKVIKNSNYKIISLNLKVTEKNKSHETLNRIYKTLLDNGFSRDSLIVAIGGGIIGDIAGYAASTFARGVDYIHVPTTLLAVVDSSVGGKTGINFGSTKNIIGSFYQPQLVLIDTDFLKTLPREEVLCGIGEIVKYGLLVDDNFFDEIKKKVQMLWTMNDKYLADVSEKCIRFKAGVVVNDEREEKGLRKILNLGHTFAHAIEIQQKHKIKHGQAVILGIACALHLSNKLELMSDFDLAKYLSFVISFSDDIKIAKYNSKAMIDIMRRDKKNKANKIKFVLPVKAGQILVDVEANDNEITYAINNGLQYFVY